MKDDMKNGEEEQIPPSYEIRAYPDGEVLALEFGKPISYMRLNIQGCENLRDLMQQHLDNVQKKNKYGLPI